MHRFGGIEKGWGGTVASCIGIENGGKPNPPSLHQKGAPPHWPRKYTGGSNPSAGWKGAVASHISVENGGEAQPSSVNAEKERRGF